MPTTSPIGTAYATAESELSLGLEATRGTAAATPLWVPVKAPKYKPDLTMITQDVLEGSMVESYGFTRGLRYDSHGWDSYPYMDNFPLFLAAELGSPDTTTTASTSTTLSAAAAAGATTIDTTVALTAGTYVVIGSGASIETHLVSSVVSTTATLAYPLAFAQPSGATVTGLTSHSWSLLNNGSAGNQPLSCTITDHDGEEWRQITGAQLDKLTIKGNATGLVDYTCSWFGNPATNPSAPSPSFSSAKPAPGWSLQASIGGSAIQYIEDWEVDMGRGVKPIPALTGTEEYFMYFAGPMTATGKITVVEQTAAPELTKYLNGSVEAIDFTVFDVVSGYALNLHGSTAYFTTGELVRSKEWVEATLDFTFVGNATDATAGGVSPLKATVANATATAYVGS